MGRIGRCPCLGEMIGEDDQKNLPKSVTIVTRLQYTAPRLDMQTTGDPKRIFS